MSHPRLVPFEFSNRQDIVKVKSLKLGQTCLFARMHARCVYFVVALRYEVYVLLSLKKKKIYGIVKLPAVMCCIVFFELIESFHCP